HRYSTGARGLSPPTPDFTAWLRSVIAYRKTRAPREVGADIQAGISDCLRFGTTLIGDIASCADNPGLVWHNGNLHTVLFLEILGLSETRAKPATALAINAITVFATPFAEFRFGLSPHAPYSFSYRYL